MSNATETTPDERRACLAGTRMLIAEETTDAIFDLLVETGTVSAHQAASALNSLARRLEHHASGKSETEWAVHGPELLDQAARLRMRAAVRRAAS